VEAGREAVRSAGPRCRRRRGWPLNSAGVEHDHAGARLSARGGRRHRGGGAGILRGAHPGGLSQAALPC